MNLNKICMLFVACTVFVVVHAVQEKKNSAYVPGHAHETAVEDLASEHGIVERLLLIYDEIGRRLADAQPFELDDLFQAADIMHRFVEEYHEKTEENYVFPVFEKKGVATRLTAELRKQHTAGRAITARVLELAQQDVLNVREKREVRKLLKKFVTMYRVHLSREDTDLFPEFRKLVSKEEYLRLSKLFDEKEDELFGEHGYKNFLHQIEQIEKRLDIYDISLVTPV